MSNSKRPAQFYLPTIVVIACAVLAPARAVAQSDLGQLIPRATTAEEARMRLAVLSGAIREWRGAIDNATFDPAAAARKIGPRRDALFAFVRDSVAYEPYRGTLRHAAGALMSRAGNACDQSLLLAEMLRTHRYEVRFARAVLSELRAREMLLTPMRREPARTVTASPARDTAAVLATLGLAARDHAALRYAQDQARRRLFAEIDDGVAFDIAEITAALAKAGLRFADTSSASSAELLSAARDHCWVQIREGDRWIDLDPAAKALMPGEALAMPTWTGASLPAELTFQMRITVIVSRVTRDQRATETLLDHAFLLDHAVHGIALAFLLENKERNNVVRIDDAAEINAFTVARPVLVVDERTLAGEPFDLATGEKLAQSAAQRGRPPGAGGFDSLRRGLDRLSPANPGQASSRFDALSVSIVITGPGGTRRVIMRTLARGGVDAAAITAVRHQVLGHWSLVATGTWIDGGFIVAEILDRIRASEALLSEFVARRWSKEWSPAKLAAAAPKRDYPVEALVYHAARAQLVERMISGAGSRVRAFAAEPQLVSFRLTIGRRSDAQGCFASIRTRNQIESPPN